LIWIRFSQIWLGIKIDISHLLIIYPTLFI